MSIIHKLPNFRSSRIYIPVIATPVMTSNHVKVSKSNPHDVRDVIRIEPIDPRYRYIDIEASDWMADHEPYRAFQQDIYTGGWMTQITEGTEQWVSLSPGQNWRSPHEGEKLKISKIEVYNRHFEEEMCKQFAIQARDGILDWETLRKCKIQKFTEYTMSAFEVEYPEDHPNGYDEYRILIQVPYGKERVGFSRIDMYYFAADHDEIAFQNVGAKNRTFPRLYEKMFVQNDDADGIVWEKKHDFTSIVAVTSWYPGFYASTSFHTGIIHPHDTFYVDEGDRVYKQYNNGPFLTAQNKVGGECIFRTKDYVVCRSGSYYYSSYNTYQWTRNGKDWTPKYSKDVPVAFWMGSPGGFGTKNNNGIVVTNDKAYRLELQDDATIKVVDLGPAVGGSYIADIVTQGTYIGDHLLQYYKFIDSTGNTYNSALQYEYQYTDMRESDPAKRVKTAMCNWTFAYGAGKYYAAGKFTDVIYYSEIEHTWKSSSHFTLLRSTNGFKTYDVVKKVDPCPDWMYSSFGFARHGDGCQLVAQFRELDEHSQPTNNYHTMIDDVLAPDYVDVPLIGFNSDPAYDIVRVRFSNTVDDGGNPRIRLIDFGVNCNNDYMGYIKAGKAENPEHYVIPTAFKKNYWSSNSYDEGGFIIFELGKTKDKSGQDKWTPKTNPFAYGTSNYMIDQHNYTYQNIID